MKAVSYKHHRFLPDVIRHAVWLYFRFTLSLRDVKELLAQRGIEVSYETIHCWTRKFGQLYARNLRHGRCKPTGRWHLDEMVVKVGGKRMWLWRAVDDEGEVLDVPLQKRRNKRAAMTLLRKLLKDTDLGPEPIVTDGLTSYRAAMRELGLTKRYSRGGMHANSRAENSHPPIRRRERKQQKFKSQSSAQRLLSSHAAVHNHFNVQQHLISRPTLRNFRAVAQQTCAAATTVE